jgi:hypothetical protein
LFLVRDLQKANPQPKANFFDSASTLSKTLHQTLIARFTQLRQPHFIAIFSESSSRVSQNNSLIPPRQTRDTAHQSQSQLAFPSIEFRITIDRASRSLFCRATDPNGSIRHQLLTFALKAPPTHIQDVGQTR